MRNIKLCDSCSIVKPVSEFWRASVNPDGLQGNCKDCQRTQGRNRARKSKAEFWESQRVQNEPGERWAPVVGFEGLYSISTHGRTKSESRIVEKSDGTTKLVHEQLLKSSPDQKGYLRVNLFRNNIGSTCYVHQMVAQAFIGPQPDGQQVRHFNESDKTNNYLENLKYGTGSDNSFDNVRHGGNHNANKTRCPQGHFYNEANTYWQTKPNGNRSRSCRTCAKDRARQRVK
jgi:hypothetical protein